MVYQWFSTLCHRSPRDTGFYTNPALQHSIWKHWKHLHVLGPWWHSSDNNSLNDIFRDFSILPGKNIIWGSWENRDLAILFHKNGRYNKSYKDIDWTLFVTKHVCMSSAEDSLPYGQHQGGQLQQTSQGSQGQGSGGWSAHSGRAHQRWKEAGQCQRQEDKTAEENI